ncbi:MAG: outer membrane beta-barrel protein [Dysgonamonadaceae bacterium]|jgi:hypothetical protein|nr:outer membrane beta-barrel protein [Dysgonamonadaceae bacterium]
MKLLKNSFLVLLFSIPAVAQKNISLTGKVVDKADSTAVIAASIGLFSYPDSTFVSGNTADDSGRFLLRDLDPGRYLLKISSIGYLTEYKSVTLAEKRKTNNIGTIFLSPDDVLLQEAIVEGKIPQVVVRNDTIEYDAGSVKTTENAVVEDILKKLPGVQVDDNGKITVNGKEVKRFMVEGKEFFSDDPQIASKNLPAEMVDKLQVLDRKSDMAMMTGFDDGEEETIINIKVREGMKKGTVGNAFAGGGKDLGNQNDARYQSGAFVNNITGENRYTLILQANNNNNMGAADLGAGQFGEMRMRRGENNSGIIKSLNPMISFNREFSKNLEITGDLRFNNRDQYADNSTEQVRYSQTTRLDKTGKQTNYLSDNFGTNIKLEWKPDSMNKLTFRPNFYLNKSHSNETEWAQQLNYNTMDSISDSYGTAHTRGNGYNFGATLDYTHKFSRKGRTFSINARTRINSSYSTENDNSSTKRFSNGQYSHDVLLDQQMENDNHSQNFQTTFAWTEPLGKNNFIQLRYRLSNNNSESLNSTYDIDRNTHIATLADSLSRSTVRNSVEQRFSLAFKASRAKYNYTIGINFDPLRSENNTYQSTEYYSETYSDDLRLNNILGDSLYSTIRQNVSNLSPTVKLKYTWDQRTNLQFDYDGKTGQPAAQQLRDYIDKSRPYEWSKGNPSLKPSYTNNLRGYFRKFVSETQLSYNISMFGNFSINDIASVTEMIGDSVRLSSYENISGNWNLSMFGMLSIPLKNRKFSVRGMLGPRFVNLNTFIGENNGAQASRLKNTQKNFALMTNNGIDYRSGLFDIGLGVMVNYNLITHTINKENNKNTVSCSIGGNTTWYLPFGITAESDINFTKRSGYDNYNLSETLWNAAVMKQLFSRKIGTGTVKLQVFDILKNRKNIMSIATIDGYQITSSNVIPSYFMCSFIYKFTAFPKSSSATKEDLQNTGRPWRNSNGPPPQVGGFRSGGPPF